MTERDVEIKAEFSDWSHVGNGHCYACPNIGNLFRRETDSPQLMHCAECRDKINAAHASSARAERGPRMTARHGATLTLDNEEIVTWDTVIDNGYQRTATAEVSVRYRDGEGRYWSASRVVKLRLKRDRS